MSLRDDIQAEALRLGFSLLGITGLSTPQHWDTYLHWLEQGRQAGMAYLSDSRAVQKRADPHLLFPEGQTMLCLALPYPKPDLARIIPQGKGRLSAYAWGKDYHDLIPPRLERLAAALSHMLNQPVQHRVFVDSAPMLERDVAQRAGLGWMGKNTCLINPQQGSFFFLAELVVNVALQADPPFTADRCGSCQRCIQACPTACILPDRTIDARRCISYLTIEHKGLIPVNLRPLLGNWVFGCDICQMVCPWNQSAHPVAVDHALENSAQRANPTLVTELGLTPDQFKAKFNASPVLRAKRKGYLRNIAVVLGNQADPATLPALAETLEHEPEPLVRAHAVWAVRQIHHPQAAQLLRTMPSVESDPLVLQEYDF